MNNSTLGAVTHSIPSCAYFQRVPVRLKFGIAGGKAYLVPIRYVS